jgi:hypothetical protein
MLFRIGKGSGNHQAKRTKEENTAQAYKPGEQEGLPQHQHSPPAQRREDKNPKNHEEQQKERRCMNWRRYSMHFQNLFSVCCVYIYVFL